MKPLSVHRIVALSAFLGLASVMLALPPAHAGVHVSLGLDLPVPVIIAPAPVVIAPPPALLYPAPLVVGREYYGYEGYRAGYRRHPPHHRRHRW